MVTLTLNDEIKGFDTLGDRDRAILSDFIKNEFYGNMSRKLVISLINRVGCDNLMRLYEDIVIHGAEKRFFMSTYDLNEFYKANKNEITSFLIAFSEEVNNDSMILLINSSRSLNCSEYSDNQVIKALYEPQLDDEEGESDNIRGIAVWTTLDQLCSHLEDFAANFDEYSN